MWGFLQFLGPSIYVFQEAIFPSMIHDRVELSKVGNISLKLLSCAT